MFVVAPAPDPAKRAKPVAPPAAKDRGRCRLELVIEGVRYVVTPRKPTKFGTIKVFRLIRSGGVRHHVAETLEGLACDCENAKYRPSVEGCKHVRACKAVGLIG